MATRDFPTFTLNDNTTTPGIGFGTYPMRGNTAVQATIAALDAGYRMVDTAAMYNNEDEIGVALRESSVDRADVLVQTKISGGQYGSDQAIGAVEAALGRLKVDVIDSMLIHWPMPRGNAYVEQWRGLIACKERGLIKSIGVSNFNAAQLGELIDATGVTPAVNQIELHPLKPQAELRAVHDKLGIKTQAWSPLAEKRAPFDAPPIVRAAKEHDVTPAQIILAWHVGLGTIPLPKSAHADRAAENLTIYGINLTDQEMAEITGLGR